MAAANASTPENITAYAMGEADGTTEAAGEDSRT
jgi:hypothetical protein